MPANNMVDLLNVLQEKNFTYDIIDGEFSMILGGDMLECNIDDEAAIADIIQQVREW